jgi:hypothetical protein
MNDKGSMIKLYDASGQEQPGSSSVPQPHSATVPQRRLGYSVVETAQLFGCSVRSVYRLIDRGLLKSSRALRTHIQIIGRCTRDSAGKKHAQFTNLIAKPDAKDTDVAISVNNMLKAITCSLLMEQVLAPVTKFTPKQDGEDTPPGEIRVRGLKGATTERVKKIIEQDINDLKAAILSDDAVTNQSPGLRFRSIH